MEHVACCQYGLSLFVKLYVRPEQITIASYNLLLLRVPYYQLFIAVLTSVELVQIDFFTSTSTGFAEDYFTQSANLTKYIGRIVGINYIYFVVALVCHSQLTFWRQLALQQ